MRARVALTVGIVGFLVLICAGCAGVPVGDESPPRVGECFWLDQPAETRSVSHSTPAVTCTDAHTHETFAVAAVGGDLARQATRPMPAALLQQQSTLCSVTALRRYLAATETDAVRGVEVRATFPSEEAWARGDRWTRCDVVTVDQGPDGVSTGPVLGRRSLAGVMPTKESADLRTCYRQAPDGRGRWDRTGVPVACSQPHSSQDVGAWLRIGTLDDTTVAGLARACGRHVDAYLGGSAKKRGLVAVGVLVGEGADQVRCSVGRDSRRGDTDDVIPRGDDGR
ncbi:MAG: septum formation family protein [Propionibacteriales bacterium]|nr:septum formation family protein [Propionibacteriales bacterium]